MNNIELIVADAAEAARRRHGECQTILAECDRTILELQAKKRKIASESEECESVATLREHGYQSWARLPPETGWRKANVLAFLLSGAIEREFSVDLWMRTAPPHLIDDRDVFLARLARLDFADFYYGDYRSESIHITPLQRLRIPDTLLADKDVVMAALQRAPELLIYQHNFPPEIFDDCDVLGAFLSSERLGMYIHMAASTMGDLVEKFSEKVRGNANLMLRAAAIFKSSMGTFDHFSGILSDNQSFAVELIDTLDVIPKTALERFSTRLGSEKGLVLACVRKNGLCLMGASEALRGDAEVVHAACANHAGALRYAAPGETRQRLVSDRVYMRDIFERLGPRFAGDPLIWQMLSPPLQSDGDLIVAARASLSLSLAALPAALTREPEFWKDVISKDPTLWLDLPEELRGDPSFVAAMDRFTMGPHMAEVFARFPILKEDRDMWSKIVNKCERGDGNLSSLIEYFAAELIHGDKALMLIACRKDSEVIRYLPSELQEDRDMIEAIVEEDAVVDLSLLCEAAQQSHPDLVARAIAKCAGDGSDGGDSYAKIAESEDAILPSLWSNLDVVRAWCQVGGRIHDKFPAGLFRDEEFGLLLAESGRLRDFARHGADVRFGKKEFMLRAVASDSRTFVLGTPRLQADFTVAAAAFGGTSRAHDLVAALLQRGDLDDAKFVTRLLRRTRSRVGLHDEFVRGSLCGMSAPPGSRNLLTMLEHDAETSTALKMLIAEYAGVPTGPKLHTLRRVLENLKAFSMHTDAEDVDDTDDDEMGLWLGLKLDDIEDDILDHQRYYGIRFVDNGDY